MPKEYPIRFPVRFTEQEADLYQAMVASAKQNRRSLNAEMLKALEFYLKHKKENGKVTK